MQRGSLHESFESLLMEFFKVATSVGLNDADKCQDILDIFYSKSLNATIHAAQLPIRQELRDAVSQAKLISLDYNDEDLYVWTSTLIALCYQIDVKANLTKPIDDKYSKILKENESLIVKMQMYWQKISVLIEVKQALITADQGNSADLQQLGLALTACLFACSLTELDDFILELEQLHATIVSQSDISQNIQRLNLKLTGIQASIPQKTFNRQLEILNDLLQSKTTIPELSQHIQAIRQVASTFISPSPAALLAFVRILSYAIQVVKNPTNSQSSSDWGSYLKEIKTPQLTEAVNQLLFFQEVHKLEKILTHLTQKKYTLDVAENAKKRLTDHAGNIRNIIIAFQAADPSIETLQKHTQFLEHIYAQISHDSRVEDLPHPPVLPDSELSTEFIKLTFLKVAQLLGQALEEARSATESRAANPSFSQIALNAEKIFNQIMSVYETASAPYLAELTSALTSTLTIINDPQNLTTGSKIQDSVSTFPLSIQENVAGLLFSQIAYIFTEQLNILQKITTKSTDPALSNIAQHAKEMLKSIVNESARAAPKYLATLTSALNSTLSIIKDPKNLAAGSKIQDFLNELPHLIQDHAQRLLFSQAVYVFTELLKDSNDPRFTKDNDLLKNLSQYREAFTFIDPNFHLGSELNAATEAITTIIAALKDPETDSPMIMATLVSATTADASSDENPVITEIQNRIAFSKAADALELAISEAIATPEALLAKATKLLALAKISTATERSPDNLLLRTKTLTETTSKLGSTDPSLEEFLNEKTEAGTFSDAVQQRFRLEQELNALNTRLKLIEIQKYPLTQIRDIFKLITLQLKKNLLPEEDFQALTTFTAKLEQKSHATNEALTEHYRQLNENLDLLQQAPLEFKEEIRQRLALQQALDELNELFNLDSGDKDSSEKLKNEIAAILGPIHDYAANLKELDLSIQMVKRLTEAFKTQEKGLSLQPTTIDEIQRLAAPFNTNPFSPKIAFIKAVQRFDSMINAQPREGELESDMKAFREKANALLTFANDLLTRRPQLNIAQFTSKLNRDGSDALEQIQSLKEKIQHLDQLSLELNTKYLEHILKIKDDKNEARTAALRVQIHKIIELIENENTDIELLAKITKKMIALLSDPPSKTAAKNERELSALIKKLSNKNLGTKLANRIAFGRQVDALANEIETTARPDFRKEGPPSESEKLRQTRCKEARSIKQHIEKLGSKLDPSTDFTILTESARYVQNVVRNPQGKASPMGRTHLEELNAHAHEVKNLANTGKKSWGKILGGALLAFMSIVAIGAGLFFAAPTFGLSMVAGIGLVAALTAKGHDLIAEGQETGLSAAITTFQDTAAIAAPNTTRTTVRIADEPEIQELLTHKSDHVLTEIELQQKQKELAERLKKPIDPKSSMLKKKESPPSETKSKPRRVTFKEVNTQDYYSLTFQTFHTTRENLNSKLQAADPNDALIKLMQVILKKIDSSLLAKRHVTYRGEAVEADVITDEYLPLYTDIQAKMLTLVEDPTKPENYEHLKESIQIASLTIGKEWSFWKDEWLKNEKTQLATLAENLATPAAATSGSISIPVAAAAAQPLATETDSAPASRQADHADVDQESTARPALTFATPLQAVAADTQQSAKTDISSAQIQIDTASKVLATKVQEQVLVANKDFTDKPTNKPIPVEDNEPDIDISAI